MATRISVRKNFACKWLYPKSNEEKAEIVREINLLSCINCDQVIEIEKVYDYQDRILLVMEYMDGRDLT